MIREKADDYGEGAGVFAKNGFESTSIQQITEVAGFQREPFIFPLNQRMN